MRRNGENVEKLKEVPKTVPYYLNREKNASEK